jgi:hypothetical protein
MQAVYSGPVLGGLGELGVPVELGVVGATIHISLVNDGLVTIAIDARSNSPSLRRGAQQRALIWRQP